MFDWPLFQNTSNILSILPQGAECLQQASMATDITVRYSILFNSLWKGLHGKLEMEAYFQTLLPLGKFFCQILFDYLSVKINLYSPSANFSILLCLTRQNTLYYYYYSKKPYLIFSMRYLINISTRRAFIRYENIAGFHGKTKVRRTSFLQILQI